MIYNSFGMFIIYLFYFSCTVYVFVRVFNKKDVMVDIFQY